MCGIAGYIGPNRIGQDHVDACLGVMDRRGPDASGVFRHGFSDKHRCLLIHTRLSILDLDPRSNQPYEESQRALVFNGELYNYLEVRERLRKRTGRFETTGDTEVLHRLLAHEGWPGLDACEGMWAFGFYDQQTGTLVLGRDRFGEKPLYLYRNSEGLYFGSEVKFIQALLGRPLAVNKRHLCRYLVNGYKSLYKQEDTFFRSVVELAPGHVLEVGPKSYREHVYWQPELVQDNRLSREDCAAMAKEALIRSVKLRLRADVPLAFCMSGGIDSNSLIGIAKRVLDYDVHGFTIVNEDARYEEQDMVEYSARRLQIQHTNIPVTTSHFLERLRDLVRYHDAPVYTITYYAQWLLMQEVAQHGYKISISGTGADELFSGYYDHFLAHLYEVRGDAALHQQALRDWQEHVQPRVRNPHLRDANLFVHNPGFRGHIYLNADAFGEYLYSPWREPFREQAYTGDLLRNRMLNELFHESVPVILHEDDLNAMYYSIENRSPFLDRGLFDACRRMPTRHLIRDGYAKVILRDAMRGIVPYGILENHRKVGFNAPIHSFLDRNDPAVRESLLDASPIFQLVRKDKIEALLGKPELPNSESKFLFYFLNAKLFLEEFG